MVAGALIIVIFILSIIVNSFNDNAKSLCGLTLMNIVAGISLLKGGIGTLLIASLGMLSVADTDYGQYIVTFEKVTDIQALWLTFGAGCLIVSLSSLFLKRMALNRESLLSLTVWDRLDGDRNRSAGSVHWCLLYVGIILGCYTLVYTFNGFITGAFDRGYMYEENILRPRDFLTSFLTPYLRLRDIFFFLCPILFVKTRSFYRAFIVATLMAVILVGAISGGRGDVIYPIILISVGLFLTGLDRMRLLKVFIAVGFACTLLVPVLESFRDSDLVMRSRLNDPLSRISAIVRSVPSARDRILYRTPQIGRQVYACSDPFLFLERNKPELGYGFQDAYRLVLSVVPQSLKDPSYKTFDGSDIAKRLIGRPKEGWFPCMSLPGDLYRRGGIKTVFVGSIFFWLVILMISRSLIAFVASHPAGVFSILLASFPVSYIRSAPLGTVSEVIWTLGWDLCKYLIVFVILSFISKIIVGYVSERG